MYEGVLNIYKERGMTSHDVVARLRGILKMKRIGHTGTLDPDAEGVLVVCLGQATKLCEMITREGKTYRAVLLLGVETDTQDTAGRVTARFPVTVNEAGVREAVESFAGDYDQVPPMYSALKVNGKKLYQLARQNITVERQPRRVRIFRIRVESVDLPRAEITVDCSKGTYIRTLCHDIGERLGCGGCMEKLVRVRSGRFFAEDSLTLSRVAELEEAGELQEHILPVEQALAEYPRAYAVLEADRLLHNGNPLLSGQIRFAGEGSGGESVPDRNGGDGPGTPDAASLIRLCDSGGRFLGLYGYEPEKGRWVPRKMFLPDSLSR